MFQKYSIRHVRFRNYKKFPNALFDILIKEKLLSKKLLSKID